MTTTRRVSMSTTRSDAGFTLLEALIALLVLSVGLLGLAALQARGIAFGHDAYVRSQATMLAYDMIDRMRMRGLNGVSGAAIVAALDRYIDAGTTADDCADAATWESAVIEDEYACWQRAIQLALPSGSATIARTAGAGTTTNPNDDTYQIVITWRDRGPEAGGDANAEKTQTWTFQL